MGFMIRINYLLPVLLGLLLAQVAAALPEDSKQNMDIHADTYEFDFQRSTTTFQGNVSLKQGSLVIRADTLVYYGKFEEGKSVGAGKIVATGEPAKFQQKPDPEAEPVHAIANRLEYSVKDETLFLIENASLNQDGTSLSGNRIEYDVKKALVKASSGTASKNGDQERVRMVIPPKTLQSIDKQPDGQQSTDNPSTDAPSVDQPYIDE